MDLDSIADELYGLAPGEFTAARDARAADVRKGGDRDLATAIKQLKRPTSSAHLVNLLVRAAGDQVDQLLDLGDSLREAQEQLDADELRRLSQERHQVVSGLMRSARKLAGDAGLQMSGTVEREVQATLEAAVADPVAGEGLRSGRLTGSMAYSGLGSVDLADVVALPARPAKARPGRRSASGAGAGVGMGVASSGTATERRQRTTAAKEALQQADTVAKDARRAVAELDRQLDRARKRHERVGHQISELKEQLTHLRAEETEAAKEIREADRAREAAVRAANVAEAQVTRAKDELDRLKG